MLLQDPGGDGDGAGPVSQHSMLSGPLHIPGTQWPPGHPSLLLSRHRPLPKSQEAAGGEGEGGDGGPGDGGGGGPGGAGPLTQHSSEAGPGHMPDTQCPPVHGCVLLSKQ